jgi:hypothetical protein
MHAENRLLDEAQGALVARLLPEKISLHGICCAVGISIRWLMDFMSACVDTAPEHLHVQVPSRSGEVIMRRMEAEAAELGSFVKPKAPKQWRWLAMDRAMRQIMALHGGDRSRESATPWWANRPAVDREQAIFYTDPYEV